VGDVICQPCRRAGDLTQALRLPLGGKLFREVATAEIIENHGACLGLGQCMCQHTVPDGPMNPPPVMLLSASGVAPASSLATGGAHT